MGIPAIVRQVINVDTLSRVVRAKSTCATLSMFSKIVTRAGTFLIVAPIIGPEMQGAIVVTSSWSAVILLIMAYGLQVRVLREAAIRPNYARSIVQNDLAAMMVLLLPSVLLAVAAQHLLLASSYAATFALMFVATVFSVIGDYCSSALRALDRYAGEAVISTVTSILQLVLAVLSAIYFASPVYLAGAILVSRLIYALVSLIAVFLDRHVRSQGETGGLKIGTTLSQAFPYFCDGSLSVLLGQIDIILLTKLASAGTIGTYAVGSRLVQLFLVVPWIATTVMVPALARAHGSDRFNGEVIRLLKAIGGISLAGAACMLIGGPIFTKVFLGHRFAGLDLLWAGFAILTVARFFDAYFGLLMTALGRLKARVTAQVGATALIGVGGLVLIPRVGSAGIILAMALAYCLTGLYYARCLRDEVGWLNRHAVLVGLGIMIAGIFTIILPLI